MRLGSSIGLVQRIVRVELLTQRLSPGPVFANTVAHRMELGREQLECFAVAPLGVELQQLDANRHPVRCVAQSLLEDFLGLQVAPVGQVDIGLGHWIDIADRIDLAQRIAQRARAGRVAGVDLLTAAGTKERVGLLSAREKRGLASRFAKPPAQSPGAKTSQQQGQRACTRQQPWLCSQTVDHPALGWVGRQRRTGGRRRRSSAARGHRVDRRSALLEYFQRLDIAREFSHPGSVVPAFSSLGDLGLRRRSRSTAELELVG